MTANNTLATHTTMPREWAVNMACAEGNTTPFTVTVSDAKINATTALPLEVPSEQTKALSPLGEAVSLRGEAAMTRVGMAANAKALPTLTRMLPSMTSHTAALLNIRYR